MNEHEDGRVTYLLVDGENIDATIGNSILNRRPQPEERPRWDRLLSFTESEWEQPAKGLFFLNASSGLPMAFVQALRAIGYTTVPLSGSSDDKVVDMAIIKTLEALSQRDSDVMLVSHDGDFVDAMDPLVNGRRRVGLMAFEEFRNSGFAPLEARGMEFFDLEHDASAFNTRLPRLRIIPIEEFNPLEFL
ncbi:NYN domain-containing protein [Ornithinimicrobium sp. Arc0846-15]|uniref:NYN domain-containing protein n=1 Tax=Ornithinimicrobium sp. INDO-MA30-4 TaxID=2908651 RepID=UPI001C66F302|nr:NYN domain-containing protein [Ornithinimicrobium sp. INDO-MA30-4]MBW8173001.1 NYN domain-containing protein [Ornithinimicrobium laminariae]UJH70030.1 NYN domain-containing protein [Ornithinimicrobium sp. INDO-MA30-4]